VKPYDYRGKTALVTGASSGIGKVFAERLAARGVGRLILVSRRESALRAVGDGIAGAAVEVVAADLAVPGGYRTVLDALRERGVEVDVLVNSAGFGTHGRLEDQDAAAVQEEVEVNCTALVGLTAALLPGMQQRRSGVIVNVGSTAGFQPLPFMAVYGATKAFVLSFSEALWGENRRSGVRVLALCPGATETSFFDRVGTEDASVGRRQDPGEVVDVALRSVDRGRPSVISGRWNAVLAGSTRLAPRRVVVITAGMTMRPHRH